MARMGNSLNLLCALFSILVKISKSISGRKNSSCAQNEEFSL